MIERILTVICIALLSASLGFYKGCAYSDGLHEASAAKQAKANAEHLAEVVKDTEQQTRALYEEQIRNLKKRKPLPDTCVLSPEFRRLHDSSAGLPESPTAQAVTVEAVAATVDDNYIACRQNIIWLEECNRICQ